MSVNIVVEKQIIDLVDRINKDDEMIFETTKLIHESSAEDAVKHKKDLKMYTDSFNRRMRILEAIKYIP